MEQAFGSVRCERRAQVALVTLNRPERRNALGGTRREDLVAAMAAAGGDQQVRTIMRTGMGSCFCAGGDLKMILAGLDAPAARPLQDKVEPPRDRTLLSVHEARKPVIATVNGPAFGAGMNLALAADIPQVIARNAPLPVQLAKRAVQQSQRGGIQKALDREPAAQDICFDTEDGREGLRAFVEKREPVFHGR